MIKKLFFVAALLMPGLAYGGPSANLPIEIVPAGSGLTGSILPPLPAGTSRWVYVGGDEFNGTSVDYTFWNATPPEGAHMDGQGCQVLSAITESGGSLQLYGLSPTHCAVQPPYPGTGVCAGSPCAGGEIISSSPPQIPGGFGPGYYEARIMNQGTYFAFWNEGIHADCLSPAAGGTENDIAEGFGAFFYNHVHWGGYGSCTNETSSPGSFVLNDVSHIIGFKWDPTDSCGYRFYYDGTETYCFGQPVGTTPVDVRFTALTNVDGFSPTLVDWFRYYRAQ